MPEVRVNNILRGHFDRRGEPKTRYTKQQAWAEANARLMNAYRCDFCGHWHIATRKPTRRNTHA